MHVLTLIIDGKYVKDFPFKSYDACEKLAKMIISKYDSTKFHVVTIILETK